MEALPKNQPLGVVIDVDGEEEEEEEEEHGHETDNEEQEVCRCSSSSTDGTTEIIKDRGSSASLSDASSIELDLESWVTETKLHLAKVERDCRICHLRLDPKNQESGVFMEWGCSCKDDLAAVHKQSAEAWFKIKGNRQVIVLKILPFLLPLAFCIILFVLTVIYCVSGNFVLAVECRSTIVNLWTEMCLDVTGNVKLIQTV